MIFASRVEYKYKGLPPPRYSTDDVLSVGVVVSYYVADSKVTVLLIKSAEGYEIYAIETKKVGFDTELIRDHDFHVQAETVDEVKKLLYDSEWFIDVPEPVIIKKKRKRKKTSKTPCA